jgi:hypothetical protein
MGVGMGMRVGTQCECEGMHGPRGRGRGTRSKTVGEKEVKIGSDYIPNKLTRGMGVSIDNMVSWRRQGCVVGEGKGEGG